MMEVAMIVQACINGARPIRNEDSGAGEGFAAVRGPQVADMVGVGVRDDDRVDVRRGKADRGKVVKDAPAIRAHGLAGPSFNQDPPTAGLDQ